MKFVRCRFMASPVLVAALVAGPAARGADTPRTPTSAPPRLSVAERLVREALTAELAGDDARRNELLSQALNEDPNCRPARWQSGCVSVDGKWLTPEDAERRFSNDQNLAEYRRRRGLALLSGLFDRRTQSDSGGSAFSDRTSGVRSVHGNIAVEIQRTASLSPAGVQAHRELARWCRSKMLTDEERVHWTQLLWDVQDDKEAETRLGLHWFSGGLYTDSQIDSLKKQHATEARQWAEWKPTVIRWRDAFDKGNADESAVAVAEMNQTCDPTIIAALEWACMTDSARPPASGDAASAFQIEAIALLGRMREQRATSSLTGHSVFARQAEVRQAATNELKKRPWHDFVPILLAGLANPIEFEYQASFDPTVGVATYRAVAREETQDRINQVEFSDRIGGLLPDPGTVVIHDTTWVDVAKITPATLANRGARNLADLPGAKFTGRTMTRTIDPSTGSRGPRNLLDIPNARNLLNRSQRFGESVAERNSRVQLCNLRITSVLEQVTGYSTARKDDHTDADEAIPDEADAQYKSSSADRWWDWWAEYNGSNPPVKQIDVRTYSRESSAASLNPTQYVTSRQGYNSTTGQLVQLQHSCFAAGTVVTTSLGAVAIENVRIGDRVLAQDQDTGELSYKPVLATSKSPPGKLLRVATSRGSLSLTPGHPFWLEGKGWRMAKDLAVGDRIHCLGGSAEVTGIERQNGEPVYNLNVADFGTYFVGTGHLLVHDFTPRVPTTAAIPGYIADAR